MSRGKLLACQIGVAVVLVAIWHLLTTTGWFGDVKKLQFFFSTPWDVIKRTVAQLLTADIYYHLGITLLEAVLAFLLGAAGGIVFGFLFARKEILALVFDPYIKAANAIPRVLLAPIFALWFGLGIASKVALGFTLVFFIVFFNVYQGVREVSPAILANARMLGFNERQLLRHVYWPAALTWVFSSLHTSIGFAIIGAVVGEYLGSSKGLGYLIHQMELNFDTTGVLSGILILMIFVLFIDAIVTRIENRLLVWRPTSGQPTT
jgi:NitT/TauT family transport system permease protein